MSARLRRRRGAGPPGAAGADGRPLLFVTNHVPPDRAGAFRALHEREPLELALFGGRSHHATGGIDDPGVPHRHIRQRAVYELATWVRYRAVVAGTKKLHKNGTAAKFMVTFSRTPVSHRSSHVLTQR